MAGIINCMRVHLKAGQEKALFKALSEYIKDYLSDDIMHHSIEIFIKIMNKENRVRDMMRLYVKSYENGESFYSFSGPVVNYDDYL